MVSKLQSKMSGELLNDLIRKAVADDAPTCVVVRGKRLFLGCSAAPEVLSYGFYGHEGWRSTGTVDAADDEVLGLLIDRVSRSPLQTEKP